MKRSLFGGIKSSIKGSAGERNISYTTRLCFSSSDKFIYNLILPWENGLSSEIDEVAISTSGIYVFEVKNYKGWIFGNQSNQYWTQVLSIGHGDTEKHKFYNPIKQNDNHIRCIRRFLNEWDIPIHSLVVFSNDAEFKDLTFDTKIARVINKRDLKCVVSGLQSQNENSLTQKQVDSIYEILSKNNGSISRREHVKNIQEKKTNGNANSPKCPLCVSNLIERTARKGNNVGSQFYGCSSYPKCRYTRNI